MIPPPIAPWRVPPHTPTHPHTHTPPGGRDSVEPRWWALAARVSSEGDGFAGAVNLPRHSPNGGARRSLALQGVPREFYITTQSIAEKHFTSQKKSALVELLRYGIIAAHPRRRFFPRTRSSPGSARGLSAATGRCAGRARARAGAPGRTGRSRPRQVCTGAETLPA